MISTTLRGLKEHGACSDRYAHLVKALGGQKAYGLNTEIPLARILDLNGPDDALWALGVCDCELFSRRLALEYALHTLHIYEKKFPEDKKTRKILRKFLKTNTISEADKAYVLAARDAAWAAAGDAAWAALDATRDAAWDAAGDAAWAAWDAARAAAGDAAWAAGDAAWAAARAAAGDAAWAAWDAAWAAWDAAWAAGDAAWAAARDDERAWQETLLRKRLAEEV